MSAKKIKKPIDEKCFNLPKASSAFIKKRWWEDTGGGIRNDILILEKGECLVIGPDSISLYSNYSEYENGHNNLGFIVR